MQPNLVENNNESSLSQLFSTGCAWLWTKSLLRIIMHCASHDTNDFAQVPPPPPFIYPSSTDRKSCTTNCKNYKSTPTTVSSKTKKPTFYISFLCFWGSLNEFFYNCNGPKPDLNKGFTEDCFGATSSSREKLSQFIALVNSFHCARKCKWETYENLLVFLEIKFLANNNAYLLACLTKKNSFS